MLTDEEARFAIEDSRKRLSSLNELLSEIDRKALSLLRIAVTIGLALVSIVVVSLQNKLSLSIEFLVGALAASSGFFLSSYFCLRVFVPSSINLPGRGPEFWLWALHTKKSDFAKIAKRYLEEQNQSITTNRDLNVRVVREFRRAKVIFMASPLIGFAATILTVLLVYWLPTF